MSLLSKARDIFSGGPKSYAKLLIKGLEPYQPMFVEEPINCQNHDLMAEIARGIGTTLNLLPGGPPGFICTGDFL